VEGSVVSNTGSVAINSIVNNTVNSIVNTQFDAFITGAYTNVLSNATTTIGKNAVVTAGGGAGGVWANGHKRVQTSISGQNTQVPFGFGFLWNQDSETAMASVNGTVTSTNGNVNVIAQMIGGQDRNIADIQIGSQLLGKGATILGLVAQTGRTSVDAGIQRADF